MNLPAVTGHRGSKRGLDDALSPQLPAWSKTLLSAGIKVAGRSQRQIGFAVRAERNVRP